MSSLSWYRLLTRSLLSLAGPIVGVALSPLQFGCGISGGCEIAGRLAGYLQRYTQEHVLIKTDLRNAFNTIARGEISRGLTEYFPGLLPWFHWAYGGSTPLVDSQGAQVGLSQTGVRQGDTLASDLQGKSPEPEHWQVSSHRQRSAAFHHCSP